MAEVFSYDSRQGSIGLLAALSVREAAPAIRQGALSLQEQTVFLDLTWPSAACLRGVHSQEALVATGVVMLQLV